MFILVTVIIVAPDFLFLTIFSDYYNHFIAFFFLMGLVGFTMNHRNMILSSFSICALLCVIIKQETSTPFHRILVNESPTFKVGHINLSNADNPFELISLISEQDLDYISFVEFTPFWKKILEESIRSKYRFRVCMERIDFYGKAIYSKYPIYVEDTIYDNGVMDLIVSTNIGGKKYHLASTFVIPSLDETSNTNAVHQLDELAAVVNKYSNNKIVLGEYNMVYWSKPIKDFKSKTDLISNRREIVPASFDIPRDHILNSDDLSCNKMKEIKTKNGIRIGIYAHYYVDEMKEKSLKYLQQTKSN